MRKLEAKPARVGIHWKRCRAHRSRSAKNQCCVFRRAHGAVIGRHFGKWSLGVNCRCTSGTAAALATYPDSKPVDGEIVAGDALYQPTNRVVFVSAGLVCGNYGQYQLGLALEGRTPKTSHNVNASQRWPVSKRVNSSKAGADDPTLIERIELVAS
jgi:hypothetical protein